MSEGRRVIAQDAVTDAIGRFHVKGPDDINLLSPYIVGKKRCGDPQQLPERTELKLKHPKGG